MRDLTDYRRSQLHGLLVGLVLVGAFVVLVAGFVVLAARLDRADHAFVIPCAVMP